MSYTPMELAEVFIKTGELKDAMAALDQQLETSPNDDSARRLRASVLLRMDEPDNLQLALNDLGKITEPTLDDTIQQSIIYERLNQSQEAIRVMKVAHKQAPDNERLLERLIELMTTAGQYDEVINLLNEAPQTWRWLMRQADAYSLNNNPEEALLALNRAQTHLQVMFPELLSPVSRNTMAQIHVARGQVYMKLDKLDGAEQDFKDALFHIPDDTTITFNLGLIYALKGNLRKATKHCKSALDNTSEFVRHSLLEVINSDARYDELKNTLLDS